MEGIWYDICHGLRLLARDRRFAAPAVLTLALGIAVTAAVLSAVYCVLGQPLRFGDPDRLVWIWGTSENNDSEKVSYPDVLDYAAESNAFDSLVAFWSRKVTVSAGGDSKKVLAAAVSPAFFATLAVSPLLGRTFTPDDNLEGNDDVIILAEGYWRSRYGSDPGVLGKTLTLRDGEQDFTIVGVMPQESGLLPTSVRTSERYQVFFPLDIYSANKKIRRFHMLRAIGRLAPGTSLVQAQARVDGVSGSLAERYPESNIGQGLRLVPLGQEIFGDIGTRLYLLLAGAGFVLLIALVNISNLFLAHMADHRREIATRIALGAGRWRVARMLIIRSLLLSCLGCGGGLVLAHWGVHLLAGLAPQGVPRVSEVGLSAPVIAWALALAVLIGLLAGCGPALQALRLGMTQTLNESGSRTSVSAGGRRFVSILVVTELALAMTMFAGAALLIKSYARLAAVDPGFGKSNILTMTVRVPPSVVPQELLEGITGLPGISSAGTVSFLPFEHPGVDFTYTIEGRAPESVEGRNYAFLRGASPDYFATMDIPLIKGRGFTQGDRPDVVLISETLSAEHWPDEDPVGQRIVLNTFNPKSMTVIGVVGSVRHNSLQEEPLQTIYAPANKGGGFPRSLVVRTATDASSQIPAVKSKIIALCGETPITDIRTMDDVVARMVARPRFNLMLMNLFTAMALVLAISGIYGVLSYIVAQRRPEIGLRMTLGATPGRILWSMLSWGLVLATIGSALGTLGAFCLSRLLASLLFEVSPSDLGVFAASIVLIPCITLLACLLPARRAARTDPMTSMKESD